MSYSHKNFEVTLGTGNGQTVIITMKAVNKAVINQLVADMFPAGSWTALKIEEI